MSRGWVGVDLDGTLAHYDGWRGVEHIGAPVEKMASRVREWLGSGVEVRVVTARASGPDSEKAVAAIQKWTLENLGQQLPVTCAKDYSMVALWDDRCVQVIPNTGDRADGKP